MKNKSDGFTSIECVVSLSIICTLVYMVSVSLYNNYFIINKNISKIEMTNIAKSTLDYIKESVRNKNISGNYNDTETINDYEIRKIVEVRYKMPVDNLNLLLNQRFSSVA